MTRNRNRSADATISRTGSPLLSLNSCLGAVKLVTADDDHRLAGGRALPQVRHGARYAVDLDRVADVHTRVRVGEDGRDAVRVVEDRPVRHHHLPGTSWTGSRDGPGGLD